MKRIGWLIVAFVAWGIWNASSDCFPFAEGRARPHWHFYGWPVCFAGTRNARLPFDRFSDAALVFDLLVAIALVASAVVVGRSLGTVNRYSIAQLLTALGSVSVVGAIWSAELDASLAVVLGFYPLDEYEHCLTVDEVWPLAELPLITAVPLACGLTCLFYALLGIAAKHLFK